MSNELTKGKPPEILFQDIRDRHSELQQSAVDIIKGWIEIGEMLIEVKKLVPNGWGARCKKELPFTKRTADRYVSLAKHSELVLPNGTPCPKLGQSPSINKALKLIAEPKPTEAGAAPRLHPVLIQINKKTGLDLSTIDELIATLGGNEKPKKTKPKAFNINYSMQEVADHIGVDVPELRNQFERYKKENGSAPDLNSIQDVLTFVEFAQS